MAQRNYWLDLFTGTTWKEFIDAGAQVSGFRESRWKSVQKIKTGDYLLCYITGISRFIAILEVTSEPYQDKTPIWKDTVFPCRMKVRPVVQLTPETAVPIHGLRNVLTIFQNLTSPHAWTGRLRGSPQKWNKADGEAILAALQEAKENPVERPVDPKKMARKPQALQAKIGPVTVPEAEESEPAPTPAQQEHHPTTPDATSHTEVQYRLLQLGSEMSFDVWVARNDRNKEIRGQKFSDRFKLKDELPVQFDEATNKTIEYIDVLWLSGNAIVAAFEIESTTSIYSGLLRMSDLISMQPNINIPLYIVAPDERRNKVFIEVNRPTFSKLAPPLAEVCRYISFSSLFEHIDKAKEYIRFLKPEFLEEISETCDLEE